jgi:hypothetical protein
LDKFVKKIKMQVTSKIQNPTFFKLLAIPRLSTIIPTANSYTVMSTTQAPYAAPA